MNTDAVAPTQKNPPQSAAADAPQSAGGVVSAKPQLPPVIYLLAAGTSLMGTTSS